VGDRLGVGLIVVSVTAIAFTVKDLNYAIYTFFMTNLTLLLISLSTPDRSPHTVSLRVYATLLGAGIVVAITFPWGLLARCHAPVESAHV
jgi:hypothetical protein